MKKCCNVILLTLALLLICSSCAQPLPDGFDQSAVEARAKEVITQLNEKNYDAVQAMFDENMAKSLPDGAAVEKALAPVLEELGAFQEFVSIQSAGGENETIGEFATVAAACAYETRNAVFTISIDAKNRICGLYVK